MTLPLFGPDSLRQSPRKAEELLPGAWLFPDHALPVMDSVWQALMLVIQLAPLQRCKPQGAADVGRDDKLRQRGLDFIAQWISLFCLRSTDRPKRPPIPDALCSLSQSAALRAGFDRFVPDSCLINHYEPGSKLSLHQDRDEQDFTQPIVSVSIGVDATFLWVVLCGQTRPVVFGSRMVMWWCLAALRGCAFTESFPSHIPIIH